MTKKKKIILSTLLGLALIIAGLGYSIWSNNAETKKGIAWIEEQGGDIVYSDPEWIEKCPSFTQEFIKKIVRSKIMVVNLSRTDVSDISLLKSMTEIQFLDLSDTHVTDLSPLKYMNNMESLDLSGAQVKDLSPLKNMVKLEVLDLSRTQVTDFSALDNMTKLEVLLSP